MSGSRASLEGPAIRDLYSNVGACLRAIFRSSPRERIACKQAPTLSKPGFSHRLLFMTLNRLSFFRATPNVWVSS